MATSVLRLKCATHCYFDLNLTFLVVGKSLQPRVIGVRGTDHEREVSPRLPDHQHRP
jgi:hypothetical protein